MGIYTWSGAECFLPNFYQHISSVAATPEPLAIKYQKQTQQTLGEERRKERGERRKERGERRKERGERRKERGEKRKERGEAEGEGEGKERGRRGEGEGEEEGRRGGRRGPWTIQEAMVCIPTTVGDCHPAVFFSYYCTRTQRIPTLHLRW